MMFHVENYVWIYYVIILDSVMADTDSNFDLEIESLAFRLHLMPANEINAIDPCKSNLVRLSKILPISLSQLKTIQ